MYGQNENRQGNVSQSLTDGLERFNHILLGWVKLRRFCTGASAVFRILNHYVGDRQWSCLMRTHTGLKRKSTSI
jgi:hypothetical protein